MFPLNGQVALSCSGFLAIVSIAKAKTEKPQSEKKRAMIDQQIEIPTKDGHTTTFISHPERGGPFPVIIFYMDAPAIREELRDMARRLAPPGFYGMLPNLHYPPPVLQPLPTPP